jgi:DNA repair protein RadD
VAIDLIRAEATPAGRALVIVDRKNLCYQWADRMRRHGIFDIGILQGDNTRNVGATVLVGTAQTIKARGTPEGVGLIVIDESHIWHKAHDQVLVDLGDAKVLGLSATPLREGLGLRFDSLVTGATIKLLMDEGHLVRPRYLAPKADAVERALSEVSIRAGDYAGNELSQAMRTKAIIGDVVGTWQQHADARPTIAFCVDKAHAFDLAAEFLAAGVNAEAIVDETTDEERAEAFRRFDTGATSVLCSVGVLGIGFDSPIASCAILARPTLSLSLYVQQGGRVLRPAPGKTDALILDHAGNTPRHGLLENFEPPTDLSQVDAETDKKGRRDAPLAWVCRRCETVNDLADDICVSCGEPRRRCTTVVVIDGELIPIQHRPDEPPAAPTVEDIRRGYRMLMGYADAKGLKAGWAYYATLRRFKIPEARAKKLIAYEWRRLPAIPPDEAMTRWLRADWQRQKIASRYSRAKRAEEACRF